MSEKPLSDALGIDQAAEEALARADVRTLRELSAADPEALAMASGVVPYRLAMAVRLSPRCTTWTVPCPS